MWYCLKIFVIWRRVPFQTVNFLKAPAKWHTSFWHSLPKHRWWFFFSLGQWRLHLLHLALKCINARELTGSPRAQLYSWSLPRSQHLVSQTFSILTSLLSPRRHGQHKMTFMDNIKWPSTSPRRSQIRISESTLPKQNRIFPHPLNLLATRFPICNTGPRPPHTRVRRFCGTCAMSLSLTPHAPFIGCHLSSCSGHSMYNANTHCLFLLGNSMDHWHLNGNTLHSSRGKSEFLPKNLKTEPLINLLPKVFLQQ